MKRILLLLLSVIAFTSCVEMVEGEGDVISREYNLKDFKGVILDVPGKLSVAQGEKSIKVTTNKNLFEWLNLYVTDSILHIYLQDKINVWRFDELDFKVTLPDLNFIGLNGSGDIEIPEEVSAGGDLKICINGSGDVVAKKLYAALMELQIDGSGNIRCDEANTIAVNASIDGSGDIRLTGSTRDISVYIDGTGSLLGFDMASKNAAVQIDGNGDCQLSVVDSLDVEIGGSGSVYYKGNPETDIRIDGTGTVQKVGD
ncbi:head GIN domain-containing protein [Saccharicrinis sp. FJH62]|uniref:head GIN domain-containing protein n=1 Tax=Saccharicrinis sp. FJH62 TaxID=3344657 RepID=UPI0035D3EEBD